MNNELIIQEAKPRIRRDIWDREGWVCWNRVWGPTWKGEGFKRKVGIGSTIREAYENWAKK